MSTRVDYSAANPILARLAIRDLGLSQSDLDILKQLANNGATSGEDFKAHIRRIFPGWEGRSYALPAILDAMKQGLDLDD